MARALRFQANLPLRFWGESLQTTCYLINYLPTPLLSNKTPYDDYTTNHPLILIFRFLDAFVLSLISHLLKFDTRARSCLFLGYPLGQKGYRVYDLVYKKMFISRNVIFHENLFPSFAIPSNTQDDLPTLPLPLNTNINNPTFISPPKFSN